VRMVRTLGQDEIESIEHVVRAPRSRSLSMSKYAKAQAPTR